MAERKYFTIITDKGQIKIANAMVYGQKLNISTVVVGDGNGTYYVPTSDMTSIKNEVWRGTISKTEILQDAQKIIRITTVIPAEVSGFVVREIGLLDEDGELVAIGNVPDLPKVALQDGASTELKLVMRLVVKNTEVFSFTIDPHTVIMTKDMLDMHDIDENAHQELLDKKADKTTMTTELDKKVDKTAMATELEKKANTNHTHNYAGSSSAGGSATSAVKLQTTRTIDGMNFNGSANITHFGVCSTAADVAEKTVSLSGFVLTEGARVAVFFANSNTHSNPKLNVNSTGAKAISCIKGSWAPVGQWEANQIVEFVYYSSHWIMITANARRLYTARTLALGGDVTGSTSFDGSANKTITATLANSGVKAGTYGPLELVTKNNGTVWVSNNVGLHSTSAVCTWKAKQACKVSFRWKVSSESVQYDYLNITAAGTQILANTGGATEQTGTLTATLAANQTLVFTYRKDGSGNNGQDRAEISEVKYGAGTADPSTIIYENNVESYFEITNGTYGFYPAIPIPNITVDAKGRITKEQTVYITPSPKSITGFIKKADIDRIMVGAGTGSSNTAVGINTLYKNTTGASNIANGYNALCENTTGYNNTANGYRALYRNTTGYNNTSNGCSTLYSNTKGCNNTAVGCNALTLNTIAGGNTAIGCDSLSSNTTGHSNTAIGHLALRSLTTYYNCTGLGANSAVTGSNQVQLGDTAVTVYAQKALVTRSDARDKLDIEDSPLGLNFIMKLRPRKYRMNSREAYFEEGEERDFTATNDGSKAGKRPHYGLVAQEVKETMNELGIDFAGYLDSKIDGGEDVLSLGYTEFIAPMIKAIQQQQQMIEQLQKEIELLKG